MADRVVKSVGRAGRVSLPHARKAVLEIKRASLGENPRRGKIRVTKGKTATGRHLVSFRIA